MNSPIVPIFTWRYGPTFIFGTLFLDINSRLICIPYFYCICTNLHPLTLLSPFVCNPYSTNTYSHLMDRVLCMQVPWLVCWCKLTMRPTRAHLRGGHRSRGPKWRTYVVTTCWVRACARDHNRFARSMLTYILHLGGEAPAGASRCEDLAGASSCNHTADAGRRGVQAGSLKARHLSIFLRIHVCLSPSAGFSVAPAGFLWGSPQFLWGSPSPPWQGSL